MPLWKNLALVAIVSLWRTETGSALIHHLDIKNDQRTLFKVETFCFEPGGSMNITVSAFEATKEGKRLPVRAGFIMIKTTSESQLQQMLEESIEDNTCILDGSIFKAENLVVDMTAASAIPTGVAKSSSKAVNRQRIVQAGGEGLYSLVFARCLEPSPDGVKGDFTAERPDADVKVDFVLHAAFVNPGPNYLSACESALPLVYLVFAAAFALAAAAWSWALVRGGQNKAAGSQVHAIHWLMLALVVFKMIDLLLDSIRFHFLAATGSAEGWAAVFYVDSFITSGLLFTVILLIGTGWSLVKPFLNDREKKIVLFVLVLQVLDNVALVFLEENAPGSQGWYTWRDVLHLVDILCCCMILLPIVWSIRHLRAAAGADGKAQHNLLKLTLFRQFYIMVVAYIYFTRIIVFLLAATLSYEHMWLRFAATEAATLLFYVVTGFKFRPTEENPYLPVSKDDPDRDAALKDVDSEFGLDGDEGEAELS